MLNPRNVVMSNTNEKANELLLVRQTENVRSILRNNYVLPYSLKQDEYDYLSMLFDPTILVYPVDAQVAKSHPHPVTATLNAFAYHTCSKNAKLFGDRAIDIGGTPSKTPKGHHICVKVDDARSDARYVEASVINHYHKSKGNANHDYSGYLNRDTRNIMCVSGAEHCTHKAPYAYSVNVYDVTVNDIIFFFRQHGLLIYDMWMFLPHMLLNSKLKLDQEYYRCVKTKEGLCKFTVCDSSNNYIHDFDEWKKFALMTKIVTPDGAIVVEHKANYGSFTHIRFTRTTTVSGNIYRTIDWKEYHEHVEVPNVIRYFNNGGAAINQYVYSFIVENTFVSKMISYGTRQRDDGFNYSAFQSYADSIKQSVFYNTNGINQYVYKGIKLDINDYEELVKSLYVIVVVQRYMRTKGIGAIISFLKANQDGFWTGVKQCGRQVYQSAKKGAIKAILSMSDDEYHEWLLKKNDRYIYNLAVRPIPKYVCGTTYRSKLSLGCNPDLQLGGSKYVLSGPSGDQDVVDVGSEEKLNTVKEVEIKPADIERDKLTNLHYKLIYNPPGDGKCGQHCIDWFSKKNGLKVVIPTMRVVAGVVTPFPTSWYTADDISYIAKSNGFNVLIHHQDADAGTVKNFISNDLPTLRLLLSNGHWTVVDCPCTLR